MLAIVSDSMRDVIEVDMLIKDFVANDDRIELWVQSNERRRRSEFAPAAVRRRVARSLGVGEAAVPGADDYRAHSRLLHVAPPLLYERALGVNRVSATLDALADVLFHARSASAACSNLLSKHSGPSSGLNGLHSTVDTALELLQRSSAGARGVESAVTKQLHLEEGSVRLLENGKILALSAERETWTAYESEQPIRLRELYETVEAQGSVRLSLKQIATGSTRSVPTEEERIETDDQPSAAEVVNDPAE